MKFAAVEMLKTHLKTHLRRAGYKCPVVDCRCVVYNVKELSLHLEVVHMIKVSFVMVRTVIMYSHVCKKQAVPLLCVHRYTHEQIVAVHRCCCMSILLCIDSTIIVLSKLNV